MAFIEERLLDKVTYGFSSGPGYLTTRVALYSGIVARNAERSLPLFLYNAPYQAIDPDDRGVVVAAFHACLGGLHGFRFKDWGDYELDAEVLGTAVGGAGETMQLIKTYSLGGTDLVRTIKKPVTGTIQLYENGTPLASTIDTTTGIVTFTSTAGQVITADVEFDVPVMFANDSMEFNYINYAHHSVDIDLMEDLKA